MKTERLNMKEKKQKATSRAKKQEKKIEVDSSEPEIKKYNIFDHWKNLTQLKEGYKEEDPEFTSSYSPYMINKFSSTVNALLPLVAEIDRYPDVPNKAHFMFYDSIMPKRFLKFETYKKSKEDPDVEKNKEYVREYFEFGRRDLDLAMKILKPEDFEKIKKKFGGTRQ